MELKRETQKYLAFLGEGIELFGENVFIERQIPVQLERSLCGLKAMSIISNEYFPTQLDELYQLISKPIKEWNLNFVMEAIDGFSIEDIVLYEEYSEDEDHNCFRGARKLKNTLSESNIDEYFSLSKQFYEMRAKLTQEEYNIFRQGLQNSIVKNLDFRKVFKGLDDKTINEIRKLFYTDLNYSKQVHNNEIHECPTCGYPMEKDGSLFYCPMQKCKHRRDKEKKSYILSNSIKIKGNYKVLVYDAQAFIKIPGIAEEDIIGRLKSLNRKYKCIKRIEVYPFKDLADLLVEFDDGSIVIIDVKDYRESSNLADYLNDNGDITQKSGVPKFDEAFIIIPDYLNDEHYIENFKSKIRNKNLKISSISTYIKSLEEKYKNDSK